MRPGVSAGPTEPFKNDHLETPAPAKQRVRELVRLHARSDARRIRDEILKALRMFLGPRRAEDDITLMVVKIVANDPPP